MSSLLISWKTLITCCLLALVASTARTQEPAGIKWRTDYAAARKEAEAKNLPILIDVMRDACPPCFKMERETFTDPRIVQLLSQRFIPLKLNWSQEPKVPNDMGITMFPTLVTASPHGHILKNKIGFQSPDDLHELMQQTLAMLTPADPSRDKYLAAVQLESKGEYHRAIVSLKDILDDAKQQTLHKDAQELLTKIEKRAADRLVQAKELHSKGKSVEALAVCTEIMGTFPGVAASREAQNLIPLVARANPAAAGELRTQRAAELFKLAEQFYANKQYIPCYDCCETLIAHYGDLPEGTKAIALSREFRNNREWLGNTASSLVDRLSSVYLALAELALKHGEVRQAQQYLQQVITAFPGTRAAESAQLRLNQLQGTVPAGNIIRP